MTKTKSKRKTIGNWWKNNETVKWLKGKITITRFILFISVLANFIFILVLVAMA